MTAKRALLLAVGFLLLAGIVLANGQKEGSEGGVKTIRVSHTLAPESHYHQGLMHWKELVESRSNGSVKVEVFHSAQLGSERDVVEGVSLGTIEATLTSTGPLPNFTNAFMVFDLPFIVQDRQKAYTWMDGPNGKKILSSLESSGIKGLGIWENGFRNLTNSRRFVESPKDMDGLKIRLMENPIHVSTFETLGARAVPMPFGELFTALQQSTVDGQENPLVIIDTSKFYEVQDYLSLTGHFYSPAVLLINLDFWNNTLTEEERQIVTQAEAESRKWQRNFSMKGEQDLRKKLQERGMQIADVDATEWFEMVQPVYQQFADKIDQEMVRSFIAAQQ